MGAGASVPDGPMDEAAARAFFGDEFSAEQFEEMADPSTGTITAEQVQNLLAPVGAEMGLEGGEGACAQRGPRAPEKAAARHAGARGHQSPPISLSVCS